MQKIRGIAEPKVSLLNIGTEAAKGNTLTKNHIHYYKMMVVLILLVILRLRR